MRLPNGYGSVYKLSGKRRKPWIVRKTTKCTSDKQEYITIGYYETKEQGLQALALYNANPYDINSTKLTFENIYDEWSKEKFETISQSNINGYKASYKLCSSLYNVPFIELRKSHLQKVVDNCNKQYPTLRKLKVLFNQLYRFAMENDVCGKDYSQYVDITKHKSKTEEKHKPFTDEEITLLWKNTNNNEYIEVILMLIYSGVRVSELLNLKKSDVNLADQYFYVSKSKTQAGVRAVPIADKTLPFFKKWYEKSNSEYLVCTTDNKHFTYRNYYDSYWKPFMEELNINHLPHDTRHTTISLLAKAKVEQTTIKKIVGHSGAMTLTEKVYTHLDIKVLLDAINSI